MNDELFISELLFCIIVTIGMLVFYQLYRSKNGVFRIIMLVYFAIDVYIYAFSAIYWYRSAHGYDVIPVGAFRLLVLVPKATIKLVLLWWLVKNNRKTSKNS